MAVWKAQASCVLAFYQSSDQSIGSFRYNAHAQTAVHGAIVSSEIFNLDNLSIIEFSGNDARQFLHNQSSADVLGIAEGQTGFACCCNPAGRVLGLLLLRPEADGVLAICSSSLAGDLVSWLKRFIFRDDVRIRLREDLLVTPAAKSPGNDASKWSSITGVHYQLFPLDSGIETATERQAARIKTAELSRGLCWLSRESSAEFLPQMLGYERIGALSFSKGCYPGQEVIARTRYLGKLKRRAVLVRADSAITPAPMSKVTLGTDEESWSAVVVDCAPMEDDSTLVMTVARKEGDTEPEWLEMDDRKIPLLAD